MPLHDARVERRVPFIGITNLRDLGGYPTTDRGVTRWGLVFRADALHKLTDGDLETFHNLGARVVYDLRGDDERSEFPGPVETVHMPIVGRASHADAPARSPDMTYDDGESLLRDIYVGILQHSATQIGTILRGLADPEGVPAVFHCHGGKDRTGVVAAVLLLTLGVDREIVLDDYEATSRHRRIEHQQDSLANMLASGMSPEAAAAVLGTPRWAMAAAVDAIDDVYGGIEAYLTGPAGVTSEELMALRDQLIARNHLEPVTVDLDHHGATVPALVYRPYTDRPDMDRTTPAIVIAAEAYGVNTFTRGVASALADQGYVVIVPDYYRGNGLRAPDDYSDFTEVMSFIDALDFAAATLDIVAAIDHARNMPEVDPDRVAVWGYCTGATLALLASALDRRLAASVLFFPSQPTFPELTLKRPIHPIDMLWAINCPLLLIYGDNDPVAPGELLADIRDRLQQWSIDHEIRLYEGAGHAFSAPVPPLRHDAAAAASWIDAVAFVDRVLHGPPTG